jgi:hypothetical protein
MNGMFMNNTGLHDLFKQLHSVDSVRGHVLDFVAISKIGRWNLSVSLLLPRPPSTNKCIHGFFKINYKVK